MAKPHFADGSSRRVRVCQRFVTRWPPLRQRPRSRRLEGHPRRRTLTLPQGLCRPSGRLAGPALQPPQPPRRWCTLHWSTSFDLIRLPVRVVRDESSGRYLTSSQVFLPPRSRWHLGPASKAAQGPSRRPSKHPSTAASNARAAVGIRSGPSDSWPSHNCRPNLRPGLKGGKPNPSSTSTPTCLHPHPPTIDKHYSDRPGWFSCFDLRMESCDSHEHTRLWSGAGRKSICDPFWSHY